MNWEAWQLKGQTAWRLGALNIARVAFYRTQLRIGSGVVAVSAGPVRDGPFFGPPRTSGRTLPEPPPLLPLRHFGWLPSAMRADGMPDWFVNPLTGTRATSQTTAWHRLPDFDPVVGDIKFIWELSRWDWAVRAAQHIQHSNGSGDPARLNAWLADWVAHNKAYCGPNWKCGQEASIRVMHLACAARILGQLREPLPALGDLVRLHLVRIAPTVGYAVGQDNNHGTSEGAALFIGGLWLEAAGVETGEARRLAEQGRRLLEERVARLVMPDGSFSQYSVNYHRLMLDTLSLAELVRRDIGAPVFSDTFYERARLATSWLAAMVDPSSGEPPLLGANDGARLLPATEGYLDFRPSVQLASCVFHNARTYPAGHWDDQLAWLDVPRPEAEIDAPRSQLFDSGGFGVLRRGATSVFVRYPRFTFRPSQADALHLDVWHNGVNLLPDGGTYSYSSDPATLGYFSGTASHNTVQFDGRDQMPRLSRFLFGAWLTTEPHSLRFETPDAGPDVFAAAYRDWRGAHHRRTVTLTADALAVTDQVSGFRKSAVLRWRLSPGDWQLDGATLTGPLMRLSVRGEQPFARAELVKGYQSRFYGRKDEIPVLEIETTVPQTIETVVRWHA